MVTEMPVHSSFECKPKKTRYTRADAQHVFAGVHNYRDSEAA
jgi:hypothetical protein